MSFGSFVPFLSDGPIPLGSIGLFRPDSWTYKVIACQPDSDPLGNARILLFSSCVQATFDAHFLARTLPYPSDRQTDKPYGREI